MHPLLFKLKRLYRKEKLPDPFGYLYKWFDRIPNGVFQVGANAGQEIKGFVTQGIRYGVFVEPLPEAFERLSLATRAQSGYVAVNAVCLDKTGRRCEFNVSVGDGAASSALKPTGFLAELHPEVEFDSRTLNLTSTTVDQIATDLRSSGYSGIVDSIDLLYMDTQGAELSVLKGATEMLKQVKYVFTEVSHGGLYEGDVSHQELTRHLESHGFYLAFLYTNKHRWGDALYVHNSIFDR